MLIAHDIDYIFCIAIQIDIAYKYLIILCIVHDRHKKKDRVKLPGLTEIVYQIIMI